MASLSVLRRMKSKNKPCLIFTPPHTLVFWDFEAHTGLCRDLWVHFTTAESTNQTRTAHGATYMILSGHWTTAKWMCIELWSLPKHRWPPTESCAWTQPVSEALRLLLLTRCSRYAFIAGDAVQGNGFKGNHPILVSEMSAWTKSSSWL